jgi:hypothetical protein
VPSTGACTTVAQISCTSTNNWLSGQTCQPNGVPCAQPLIGACCYFDGGCLLIQSINCAGTFRGNGTVCPTANCPQPMGACCVASGACTFVTRAACTASGGTYRGNDVECLPQPCPQPMGVCCRATTCLVSLAANCTGPNTAWTYVPTPVCNAANNLTTPCCKADFNKVDGVTVDDLFLYFNAYFLGQSAADISGNGSGSPTIDDLYLYINAWTLGCP